MLLQSQYRVCLSSLCCLASCERLLTTAFRIIGRRTIFDMEISVLARCNRIISGRQFHLVTARRTITTCCDQGDVRDRLILSRLKEEDITGWGHFPDDRVTKRYMGDFLVDGKLHLDGGTQRAHDPGDIVSPMQRDLPPVRSIALRGTRGSRLQATTTQLTAP